MSAVPTFTRDEVVRLLVETGVPRDKASEAANKGFGSARTAVVEHLQRRVEAHTDDVERQVMGAGRSEIEVQTEGVRELRANGWEVWRVGQRNAKGTQDAGVSDVIAINITNPSPIGVAFIEYKREKGGRQSDAQRAFQDAVDHLCRRRRTHRVKYFLARSLDDIRELLDS